MPSFSALRRCWPVIRCGRMTSQAQRWPGLTAERTGSEKRPMTGTEGRAPFQDSSCTTAEWSLKQKQTTKNIKKRYNKKTKRIYWSIITSERVQRTSELFTICKTEKSQYERPGPAWPETLLRGLLRGCLSNHSTDSLAVFLYGNVIPSTSYWTLPIYVGDP